MSRIRSVHPGLWTDERFVSVSGMARLLFIGIWNECDDQGSFEWSPIKLKMRLLPADNVDAAALLTELEAAGCVRSYDCEGRKLGAVRNFTTYQRPKKPNSVYPQTEEVRKFVGFKEASVPNQLPTGGEKAPQMEDGEEDGEEKEKEEGDAGEPASTYAFSGSVIRLVETDLHRWRKTYHGIPDIVAELSSLDSWFATNPAKQKNWFHTAQGALNRKHQEFLKSAKANEQAGEWVSPC